MALVYILMPKSFGSVGAVRAIFGGQPVLVFLAMSALVTLLVAEFDLSVASIMGLSATIVPVLAGLHGVNVCGYGAPSSPWRPARAPGQ